MAVATPSSAPCAYAILPADSSGGSFAPQVCQQLSEEDMQVRLGELGAFIPSGGELWTVFKTSISGGREVHFLQELRSQEPIRDEVLAKDIIRRVSEAFALTTTQASEVFDITRKTLHNWKNGATPRSASMERMLQLHALSTDWENAGFQVTKSDLDTSLVNGKSLLELLSAKTIDRQAIMFAGNRLAMLQPSSGKQLEDPFA